MIEQFYDLKPQVLDWTAKRWNFAAISLPTWKRSAIITN